MKKNNDKYATQPAFLWNIVRQVFAKNLKEQLRYPLNFIISLLFGLVWFLPTYFTIKSFVPDGVSAGLQAYIGVSDYYGFYMIGLIIGFVISQVMWTMGFSLKRMMDIGVFETVWSYPIPKLWYLIAESLFSAFEVLYNILLMYVMYAMIFKFKISPAIVKSAWVIIPLILTSYGFGIILASVVMYIKNANTLIDTSNFLVQGLSGTGNPVQAFTKFLTFLSLLLPWTYLLDIIRSKGMQAITIMPLTYEYIIIAGFSIFIPLLSVIIFRNVDKKCRTVGVLHSH